MLINKHSGTPVSRLINLAKSWYVARPAWLVFVGQHSQARLLAPSKPVSQLINQAEAPSP